MVTGKIKGGIQELIQILNDCNARAWKLVYDDEKPTNATVFISDVTRPREDEIERMKRILAATSISRCFVIIDSLDKSEKDKNNQIKYEFSNVEDVTPRGSISGFGQTIGATPTGLTREDVDRMIADAKKEVLMDYKLESLEQREKELREERKEFEASQQKVGAVIVNALAPYLQPLFEAIKPARHLSVAGIDNAPEPQDSQQEENEPEEEQEEQNQEEDADTTASHDAQRLADALRRFQTWDDEYIDVICKLVDLITSGNPIAGMNYATLKSLIMNL